jgi:hypothetical protein
MRYKLYIILFLLILALLIQNTCPHGFACKSMVAAACSHCPHKQMLKSPVEYGQVSIASHRTAHLPMYVLDVPNTQPAFQLMSVASSQPIIPNSYKNTTPDELLRPPHA